ncbi:DUF86 domain-containing protein [bacterium]|nr:DUF86 domain-containing protein [bacterium]
MRRLNLEEFKEDRTAQLAAERAFQAATECCCDIGNHLIAVARLQQPDEQRKVFPTLAESGYFDQDYANRMSQMVALRNRLVHLYWDIDMCFAASNWRLRWFSASYFTVICMMMSRYSNGLKFLFYNS